MISNLPQELAFYKSENILPQMPMKWEWGKSEVVQGRKGEVEDSSTLVVVRESSKAHHINGETERKILIREWECAGWKVKKPGWD